MRGGRACICESHATTGAGIPMHRPVQSGGRRSTAVSQTTELRCVTHDTSPGQPSELPQTRRGKRCFHASTSRCTLDSSEGCGFCPRHIIQKDPATHQASHYATLDLSQGRFTATTEYGFKVYCSCTGTVLLVGTLTMPTCRADLRPNQPPIPGILP